MRRKKKKHLPVASVNDSLMEPPQMELIAVYSSFEKLSDLF